MLKKSKALSLSLTNMAFATDHSHVGEKLKGWSGLEFAGFLIDPVGILMNANFVTRTRAAKLAGFNESPRISQ
jgi:hypothetical protein